MIFSGPAPNSVLCITIKFTYALQNTWINSDCLFHIAVIPVTHLHVLATHARPIALAIFTPCPITHSLPLLPGPHRHDAELLLQTMTIQQTRVLQCLPQECGCDEVDLWSTTRSVATPETMLAPNGQPNGCRGRVTLTPIATHQPQSASAKIRSAAVSKRRLRNVRFMTVFPFAVM